MLEANGDGKRSFRQWPDDFVSWGDFICEKYLVIVECAVGFEERGGQSSSRRRWRSSY